MEGHDEITFLGQYKDFNFNVTFDLNNKSEKDAAAAMDYVRKHIEKYAYEFAPVNLNKVRMLFKDVKISNLSDLAQFLEVKKLRDELITTVPMPELVPVAESALLWMLFEKIGISLMTDEKLTISPQKAEFEDTIALIGKYKNWTAIKKLSLEGSKDYEISGILSGITYTLVQKSLEFASKMPDAKNIAKVSSGKRKSFGNLAAALRAATENNLTDGPSLIKVCEAVGYFPYPTTSLLSDAYPSIKPPKVKGRKPK